MRKFINTGTHIARRLTGKTSIFGIAALVLIISAVGIYTYRHQLAPIVWNTFHLAPLATLLDSRSAALYEAMGNYYFESDHYDVEAARRYFEKAVALDTHVPLAHYQLARIYFITGNSALALQEVDTQFALYPGFERSYYMRGLIYSYAGELNKAVADFRAFLAWKPESWAAHNDLAWVYFKKGDFVHAEGLAREGLAYTPDNAWLLTMRGVSLLNLGKKREAAGVLASALAEAQKLTKEDWIKAYPGNDPKIAEQGLREIIQTIEKNLALAN